MFPKFQIVNDVFCKAGTVFLARQAEWREHTATEPMRKTNEAAQHGEEVSAN